MKKLRLRQPILWAVTVSQLGMASVPTLYAAELAPTPMADVTAASNQGQELGLGMLGVAQMLPGLTEGGGSSSKSIDMNEMYGGTGQSDIDKLKASVSKPENMVNLGQQISASARERGCRTTSFAKSQTRTVLTVQAYQRVYTKDSTGKEVVQSETPVNYTGTIRLSFPSIGSSREFIDSAGRSGNIETVLKYTLSPFQATNDGSNFTYDHVTTGLTGTISSFGNRKNGYATQGTFKMSGVSSATVKATLYKVSKTYSDRTTGACAPDPADCTLSGVNFCSEPGLGVKDVFETKTNGRPDNLTAATDLLLQTKNNPAPSANDRDISAIFTRNNGILDGTDPVFNEIFQGCGSGLTWSQINSTDPSKWQQCTRRYAFPGGKSCTATRSATFGKLASQRNVFYISSWRQVGTALEPYPLNKTLDVSIQAIGTTKRWEQAMKAADGTPVIVKFEAEPFTVDANIHAVQNPTGGTFTTWGSPRDNYTLKGQVTVGKEASVAADLYNLVLSKVSGCEEMIKAAYDAPGFTSKATCTSAPTSINGVKLTGAGAGVLDLFPSWGPAEKPIATQSCWGFNATASWTNDAIGTPDAKGWISTCNTPSLASCRLVKSKCTEQGANTGTCLNETQYFDCSPAPTGTGSTADANLISCATPIRCMGTECSNIKEDTPNQDFGKAAAAAETMDMVREDYVCAETGEKPTADQKVPCTPLIFGGKNMTCKIGLGNEIGITPDCCAQGAEMAAGVSWIDYLRGMEAMKKATEIPTVQAFLAQTPGYTGVVDMFNTAKSEIGSAVSQVTTPISNALTNGINQMGNAATTMYQELTGRVAASATESAAASAAQAAGTEAATAAATDASLGALVNQMQQKMLEMAYNFLTDMVGKDITSQLITQTGGAGGSQYALSAGAQQVLQYFNTVMLVYTVAKLIGHMVVKCQEEDFNLAVSKQQKLCSYVGSYCDTKDSLAGCLIEKESYCCYKSALTRIIAEQLRKGQSVGGGYGSAESPRCGGFSLAELQNADWSRVDLSEWTDMLDQAGILPKNPTALGNSLDGPLPAAAEVPVIEGDPNLTREKLQDLRFASNIQTIETNKAVLKSQQVCRQKDSGLQYWYSDKIKAEDVIKPMGGTGGVSYQCDSGDPSLLCIDIWMGKVGDNYYPESCSIPYVEYFDVWVGRPDLIERAHFAEGQFDDHLRITINNQTVFQDARWTWGCEQRSHWCVGNVLDDSQGCRRDPNEPFPNGVDVTNHFKQAGRVSTKTETIVGGWGEGFGRVRVYYKNPEYIFNCTDPAQL